MRTLLLLSTITLATATNTGLGYLECASSIASTYHSTACTSTSNLDCFCNAPFNPSDLDQATLDSCATAGVRIHRQHPRLRLQQRRSPVSARKGSQPMMRVASDADTTNTDANANEAHADITVTMDTTTDGSTGENSSSNSTASVVVNKPANMDARINLNTPRAYAPDPTAESKVHMTDASNADVVYNVITETETECACKETKAPVPGAPDADTGVDATETVTSAGQDVPATEASTATATATVPAAVPATGTATATGTDTATKTETATATATGSTTPSAESEASATTSSPRLFTTSTATATSTVVASGTPGPLPSGVDPTRTETEDDGTFYDDASSPGTSQSGNGQGGELFEGAAGRSVPQAVGVVIAAGLVASWML
ncbi:hypothetical protein BO70DRAFT_401795 [Aspergillus heteromorphus CBS 117.55]|uniref:Extracellular membrane protein CFEM domain-containing protein n=1 Tax=Aspergillus heteromorphus CBS 117.55 TaxID=1448321 RepID=A0A317X345_9EURO|nr:uncharacterized protein BO70DRAFT_401795 [Aspergillus heteromorphus CBS 117.55]PWY92052.1 hypothetical protein BO70DRAFT_401795 [Aspergillus heteromorphus CBS 117.55]